MLCCTIAVLQVAFLTIKLDDCCSSLCRLLSRIAINQICIIAAFVEATPIEIFGTERISRGKNSVTMSTMLNYQDLTYGMVAIIHHKVQHIRRFC